MLSLHSDIPIKETEDFIRRKFKSPFTSKILLPLPLRIGNEMYKKLHLSAVEIAKLTIPSTWNKCTLPGTHGTTPDFMTIDYAVGHNKAIHVIELQAFPSVMFSMWDLTDWFSQTRLSQEERVKMHNIIENKGAKKTVLIDNRLHSTATRFDFISGSTHFDVAHPEMLYCQNDSVELLRYSKMDPVTGIFNRVIFDSCSESEKLCMIQLMESQAIKWINHPAWFYLINKGTMRHLQHPDIPKTIDIKSPIPADLKNWVLKRNDGFSSDSVTLSPTVKEVDQARSTQSILQQRVEYAPCVTSSLSSTPMCAEIRVMLMHNSENSTWELMSMMARITKDGETSRATSGKGDVGEGVAVVMV